MACALPVRTTGCSINDTSFEILHFCSQMSLAIDEERRQQGDIISTLVRSSSAVSLRFFRSNQGNLPGSVKKQQLRLALLKRSGPIV